jgi:hypothetical protein
MLNAVMLSVLMLIIIMLNVAVLSVVAPLVLHSHSDTRLFTILNKWGPLSGSA